MDGVIVTSATIIFGHPMNFFQELHTPYSSTTFAPKIHTAVIAYFKYVRTKIHPQSLYYRLRAGRRAASSKRLGELGYKAEGYLLAFAFASTSKTSVRTDRNHT